ncbi:unnamed protein product [Caenorhabditis sp. 36 PRJEB53466]|nr:unnamed protein product [Caenorhabditis sp. 36 PRJEB53466]
MFGQCERDQPDGSLQLIIDHPKEMKVVNSRRRTEMSECTPTQVIGGVPWKFYAHIDYASDTDHTKQLSFYLMCCLEVQSAWAVSVTAVLRHYQGAAKYTNKPETFDIIIRNNTPNTAFRTCRQWDDVLKYHDDARFPSVRMLFEFRVTIKNVAILGRKLCDFSMPDRDRTDSMLKVYGHELYVNTRIMARYCKSFRRAFYVEKGNVVKIYLDEEETVDDFIAFLQIIYGHSDVLNVENVNSVIQIAKRYESKTCVELCEQFMIRSKFMEPSTKLHYAVTYQLRRLEKILLRQILTCDGLDSLSNFRCLRPLGRWCLKRRMEKQVLKKKKMKLGRKSVRVDVSCVLLNGQAHRSGLVMIDNVPWRLELKLTENRYGTILKISLVCDYGTHTEWYCDVTAAFTLFVPDEYDNCTWTVSRSVSTGFTSFEESMPVSGEEGPKQVRLNADIRVQKFKKSMFEKKTTFWMSNELTNVALIVEGVKFNVIKELLAAHSPYFNTMFFTPHFTEYHRSRIVLPGIKADEFEEFLHMIHDPVRPVTRTTFEALLRLADYLDAPGVKERCDWYLCASREHFPFEKEQLASDYRLENTMIAYPIDWDDITLTCRTSEHMRAIVSIILDEQEMSDETSEPAAVS